MPFPHWPTRAHQVERKEAVGERGLLNPLLPQAFSRSGGQLREAGQAVTSSPYQWKGLLPRAPLLRLCPTPAPQLMAGAGEDPCSPCRIYALNGFPREWLSKSLTLIKTGHEWQVDTGGGGGVGMWLYHNFQGGDHCRGHPSPLHCCFLKETALVSSKRARGAPAGALIPGKL